MKKILRTLFVFLTMAYSALTWAHEQEIENKIDFSRTAWGAQIAATSGGNISPGFVRYAPNYSAGITASANLDNNEDDRTFSVEIFGGPRYLLLPATYFAYGLEVDSEFGKKHDKTIEASYAVGPYVGIDYYFSTHVLISAFISPYTYQYERLKDESSTSTNKIFSSGGIGLSYLF